MPKAPQFWYKQETQQDRFLRKALKPLGHIYAWLVRLRGDLYYPVPMAKPVICVGNLTAGGAGKTPTVMSLTEMLKEKGYNPHILTRGYGGEEEGPIQVSPEHDTVQYVGDEALLLVAKAPTWVAKNRPLGAQSAIDSGAEVIIMDDGFQNPVLYKNFSLLVVDGLVGFGNRSVLPAGPLREPLERGLPKANAVLLIGEDKTNVEDRIRSLNPNLVIYRAALAPCANNLAVRGKKLAAFAGIGVPDKFKNTLESQGAEIVLWQSFPDHHKFTQKEVTDFVTAAEAKGAEIIITTAKDHVRLPDMMREKIAKYDVELQWPEYDRAAILEQIENAIAMYKAE